MKNTVLRLLEHISAKVSLFRYRRRMDNFIRQGLNIGKNVTIMPTAWIDPTYPFLVSIGDNCSISRGVRIHAHDASMYKFIGATRIGKVVIKENCFIGENVIILPGVTIGPNVLIAAGSMVNKDIPPNSCIAGVPARFYARFDEYIDKHTEALKTGHRYQYDAIHGNQHLTEVRRKIVEESMESDVYVTDYTSTFPWTLNKI